MTEFIELSVDDANECVKLAKEFVECIKKNIDTTLTI